MKTAIIGSLIVTFGLAGCSANWDSIYRETDNNTPKTSYIDAKQRAVLSNKRGNQLILCAEKSPDVFSVLSAAASGKITYKEVAAEIAGSSSESGANIGLRTQLTQAQSEFLYRVCEQYMNGAISQATVETELRRFPTTIVALLAIEQLTGYARPSFVALGGQGAAGRGANINDILKAVDEARSDNQSKQKSATEATQKLTDAQKVLDEKVAAKKKLLGSIDTTQIDKDIATATSTLKAAQDKKTSDEKTLADDTKLIADAQKLLDEKNAAKRALPEGADTSQIDKEINDATIALKAAQDKKTSDGKTLADDTKLIADAQKLLDEKNAAKLKLQDTPQADKEIKDATAGLQSAKDNKQLADEAAKDSETNLKHLEAARDAAWNSISASTASNPAQFLDSQKSGYSEANPQSVQAVATAVTEIVNTVTNQTFTTEVCLKSFFEDDKLLNNRAAEDLLKFCIGWMKDINTWKLENLHLTFGLLPDGTTANPATPRAGSIEPPNNKPSPAHSGKAPVGPYIPYMLQQAR